MKLRELVSIWQKPPVIDDNLLLLEGELNKSLTQVAPRPQFVVDLRQSLLRQFENVEMSPPTRQHHILQTILLITGGVLGSFVVFLTGLKGLISVVGAVGLIIRWFRQNSDDSITQPNLVQ